MRFGSLFSGIGGLDLGLEMAGMECAWQCEKDAYASSVLEKHWPDVPRYEDIHDIDAGSLSSVDLICGGYPCQPFSVAGKRQGQADDRHLWPVMRQIIATVRPAWVLCENVAGHVTMGLDQVISDLEAEGYSCWPLVIPAVAVAAPHRRERVWIVAHDDRPLLPHEKHEVRSGRNSVDVGCAAVADTIGLRELQPQGSEQNQRRWSGDGCRWKPEPGVGRVAYGVPRAVDRLKCLGNAVVPQVAYEIGRAIMAAHNSEVSR